MNARIIKNRAYAVYVLANLPRRLFNSFTTMGAEKQTLGLDPSHSRWQLVLLYLWSVAVGASVAACGVFSLRLNPGLQVKSCFLVGFRVVA